MAAAETRTLRQRQLTKRTKTTSTGEEKLPTGETKTEVLSSAPPPSHTFSLFLLFVALAVYAFPAIDSLDSVATVETWTKNNNGLLHNPQQLALVRALFAFVIWGTSLSCIMGSGWDIIPPYVPTSKLKCDVPIRMLGLRTMCPFTSWYAQPS